MPSKAELICVDPARVSEFWPYVKDALRTATQRTQASDWADDERRVLSGSALLWLAWNGSRIAGSATTEIVVLNGAKHCYITGCGGSDSDHWISLIAGLESFAAREGCKSIRILGRTGFRRKLEGYREHLVLYEKEIS